MRSNTDEQAGDLGVDELLVDLPARTASARAGPNARPGPGISRSTPASADAAVPVTPNQSVTTKPSNPHSSRRMPPSRSWCSVHQRPLSRL